jgi:putative tricarboxylic transport membrane protein
MNKERIGSLFFLFVGMYAFFLSLQLPIGTWKQPRSGFFPLILSVLLCIVAALLFISGKGKEKIDWRGGSIGQRMIPWQIVVLTFGFILAMEKIGYLVTSFLYLFGLFLWVCHFRLWVAMILSGLLAPAIWYFFGKILGLHLPIGPWGL